MSDAADSDDRYGCDKYWGEMRADEQRAVECLGWSHDSWDEGTDQTPYERLFQSLAADEQAAAVLLGLDPSDFLVAESQGGHDSRDDDTQQQQQQQHEPLTPSVTGTPPQTLEEGCVR
jgi:hypothetical protein